MTELHPQQPTTINRNMYVIRSDAHYGIVATTWRYTQADPLAVTTIFHAAKDIEWVFGRELLYQALLAPINTVVGEEGDISFQKIAQTPSTNEELVLRMRLHPKHLPRTHKLSAELDFAYRDAEHFLKDSYELVPHENEGSYAQPEIDSFIKFIIDSEGK